ncbi:MAG: sodium-dependent transporter [Thermoplasmata archaeon]|nr:MAG: sodium-dependent transporter [Thermoplasmata archaeon]
MSENDFGMQGMYMAVAVRREHWHSRFAFVMAAVGSAVGLGNVWRFPYVCYKNGGGAFLIPYFVALFTAGIPLMVLEFSFGHWARGSPPTAFRRIGRKWEWFGWWTVLIPFGVASYYVVVMSWCFSYMIYSLDLRWDLDADVFFRSFLGDTGDPLVVGGVSVPVLLGLAVVWFFVFLILYRGVGRIGRVVAVTVPLPTLLLFLLTVRGLTLPGALEGVGYYLTPDFSELLDVGVWLSAFAQVFFSLSLAQGIMITYASYLRRDSDVTNNAFIISLADAGTSFLAGFTVFSVVGYLAVSQGVGVDGLGIAGPELTFITYPTAISLLPFAAVFFGVVFYVALLTFGIDSAFSMIEPMVAGVNSRWGVSKFWATGLVCLAGFLCSIFFSAGSGLYWLELVDHFVADFGLVLIGLFECLLLGWFFGASRLRKHANSVSDVLIGRWWDVLIRFVVPVVLAVLLVFSVYENICSPYLGYPWWVLLLGGVMPCLVLFLLSFVFARIGRGRYGVCSF